MLHIKKEHIKSLPKYKKDLYWGPNNTLYKVFRIPSNSTRDEYYLYINKLKNISGLVLPLDLIKDGNIFGYQLSYIPNSNNINEIIQKKDNNLDIIKTIKSIFLALENIHKHFIIGDIKNSNILIKNNIAYFIDWDMGKKLDSEENLLVDYRMVFEKHLIMDNKIHDIIKAFICALSLYYEINLERYFANRDLTELLTVLQAIKTNHNFICFLEYLIYNIKKQNDQIDLKFSQIIDYVDLPTKLEKERLVRILRH